MLESFLRLDSERETPALLCVLFSRDPRKRGGYMLGLAIFSEARAVNLRMRPQGSVVGQDIRLRPSPVPSWEALRAIVTR